MSTNNIKFMPFLKPKRGELVALKNLSIDVKDHIIPIFDIHAVTVDAKGNKKKICSHLEGISDSIEKHWGDRPFVIDLYQIDLDLRTDKGIHPVEKLCENLKNNSLNFTLVTGIERDKPFQKEVKKELSKSENKTLYFRLFKEDLEAPKDTAKELDKLLEYFVIESKNVGLLLDFRSIDKDDVPVCVDLVTDFNEETSFDSWKEVTICASSFPTELSVITKDTIAALPRHELTLWEKIVKLSPLLGCIVHYSDYGINNPDKAELDPRKVKAGGKIRYTSDKSWVVARGHRFKESVPRKDQYHDLSLKVVAHKDYKGKDYSWGDNRISESSKNVWGSGSLEIWVQIDFNHHITFVSRQISSYRV